MVSTANVRSFSFARRTLGTLRFIAVNGHSPVAINESTDASNFNAERRAASLSPSRPPRRYGPLLSILTSAHPLRVVVGSQGPPATTRHLTSIAQRIAHDAKLYGGVDVDILFDEAAETLDDREGNVVLLGGGHENALTARWASSWATPSACTKSGLSRAALTSLPNTVSFLSPSAFAINERIFETPGQGECSKQLSQLRC